MMFFVKRKKNPYKKLKKARKFVYIKQRLLESFKKRKRVILLVFICALLFAATYGILSFISTSGIFSVKSIEFIGNFALKEDIKARVNGIVINKSLITIPVDEVRKEITENTKGVGSVYLYKNFPNKLVIEVVEKLPTIILIQFDGTYTISNAGDVMLSISDNKLELNEIEYEVLDGVLDINSNYVRDIYLSKINDSEERARVKWAEVSVEEKTAIAEEIKNGVNSKIELYVLGEEEKVQIDKFENIPIIISYIDLKEGGTIDIQTLNFSQQVIESLNKLGVEVRRNIWKSAFTFSVETRQNQSIYFSLKRDISEQLRDLATLKAYGIFQGAKIIDLRSKNYSVVR